jgi:hypothetical protein
MIPDALQKQGEKREYSTARKENLWGNILSGNILSLASSSPARNLIILSTEIVSILVLIHGFAPDLCFHPDRILLLPTMLRSCAHREEKEE